MALAGRGREIGMALAAWLLVAALARVAAATEARVGIDPAHRLSDLSKTGEPALTIDRHDGAYFVDASAVLAVDPTRLLAASLDYQRLVMGLYALLTGRITAAGPLFLTAAWSLTAIALAMLGAAACPGLVRRQLAAAARALGRLGPGDRPRRLAAHLADLTDAYRADLVRFLRMGRLHFAAVYALSLVFLLARCALPYLCARFLGLGGGSLREVIEAQMALVFLVFFAPTPGGAGVAETASLSIMADVVPAGYAPYYNLLWRFSTTYLAAIAGALCLARAALADARRAVWRA